VKITSAGANTNKLLIRIVVALAVAAVVFWVFSNLAKRRAEGKFRSSVESVATELIELAVKTEPVVDEINAAWRDAIFSDYNKRDFNEAILEVHHSRRRDISSIEERSADISQKIKAIVPPEGKEHDYERLKEIYLLFDKYSNMAIAPSGSLQTYSEQNNELSVEIRSAIRELEMMK
jgi:hypothetical protein